MSDTNFDYTTQPFLQKAENPGFWHYAATVARGIDRYFRFRRDRHALEQMPDHLLKDIGIDRSEIHGVIFRGIGTRFEGESSSKRAP